MKKYLLVILTILVSHIALSQCMVKAISLTERVNSSSTIVEGEVISKQSYWDAKRQNIFTVNIIKPFKSFKGMLLNNTTIEVITMGGTVGLTRDEVSNALQLNVGDIGIFILKDSPISLTKGGNFLTTVEGAQGFIRYDLFDHSANDGFNRYPSVENQLYQLIESKVGQNPTILKTVNIFQNTANFMAGSISSISPTNVNAGVSDILTINGSGFGTSQGQVRFRDGNSGGTTWVSAYDSDIISWSDTQIKVKVISYASTGQIRVKTLSDGNIDSDQILTVKWAHLNVAYDSGSGLINFENNLRGKDANGGYQFQFAPNFSAANAQASLERALATWNCGSGVNFETAGSTSVNADASDDTNIVMYMTAAEIGSSGTLAYARSRYSGCFVGESMQWYIKEIDIVVNSDYNWNYGTGNPSSSQIDFETVILHEIGHAHQLGHVGQSNEVMYYSVGYGVTKRDLSTETLNGADYVMNKSTTISVCSQPIMTTYAGPICCNDPEIISHPANAVTCDVDSASFTVASNFATDFQWQVNTGTGWTAITNNATYSNAETNTLNISAISVIMNGYQYRCIASNTCTAIATSNAATLTIDTPEATLTATEETPCDTNDGTITFTFPDNPNRTNIQFSIDGGNTYPYIYDDNLGAATITDIAPDTYTVYSKWGNNNCEIEIGDITVVEKNNPEAFVEASTPSNCSSATGSVTLNWVVDPIRTHIEFSTDGGITYPHSITNPSGTITIGSLPYGTIDLWVRWGNSECPIDMEDVTIGNSNCDFSNGFVTTWKTDNTGTSNNNSITIPIASTGTYNYHIDWGDGLVDYNVTTSITHPYDTSGTYQVKIIGDFPQIKFNNSGDKNKILSVEQWGTQSWTSMEFAFWGCSYLEVNASDIPDLSNVTSMRRMFQGVSSLNQDISLWDVSTITNMGGVFWDVTSFNQDISNWNVENVTTMNYMFNGASSFNQDISSWDVSNVNNTYNMFEQATSFNQDLGAWDISSVTNMANMFKWAGLSVDNYDNTLIGWNTLDAGEIQIPENITFSGGNSNYCIGENARASLMSTPYSWTITDGGVDCSSGFITTWKTDNTGTSDANSITILTQGTDPYNYNVDWGDGQVDTNVTTTKTHNYATAGEYTVNITGDFPFFWFGNTGDKEKLLSVEQWGAQVWKSMQGSFYGCSNVVINATDSPDLSQVDTFYRIFRGATSMNQDISAWDVSNITNMQEAFMNASVFNQDISAWDVSSVTNMANMFRNASAFNQNIGNWNVSNVTLMNRMFENAVVFNQDISSWDVSNVTVMFQMFLSATDFDQDLGLWDSSSVTNMAGMFDGVTLSTTNYDNTLIGWSTLDAGETQIPENITFSAGNSQYCNGEVARTNLTSTPYNWIITDGGTACPTSNNFITIWETTAVDENITIPTTGTGYNYDIDWNNDGFFDDLGVTGDGTHTYAIAGTHTVTMRGDFPRIYFNNTGDKDKIQSVEQWGTGVWSSMGNAFYGCSNLEINATDTPDLSNVTTMSHLFREATSFNQDISTWDVSSVTSMISVFRDAISFNQDISAWNVSGVTEAQGMFNGATSFNQNLGAWDVSSVTNMGSMFLGATAFDQDLSAWNTSSVTNMANMFNGATLFNQDLSIWDVSNVTVMFQMFLSATDFDQDLGLWDISSVTNMAGMFDGSTLSLTNYDNTLIGWNTLDVGETQIPENITFNGGNSQYCAGEAARTNLMNTPYSWTITDAGTACAASDNFITTWETTAVDETITIPTTGTGYNYDIDWDNDGIFDDLGVTGDAMHIYPTAGTHTVVIRGDFPRIYFNYTGDEDKILSVEQWGTGTWSSMERAFQGCSSLVINAVDTPDLSNVTNMSNMFYGAYLFNQDINSWDVSNVTNMNSLFGNALIFNQDISSWDVSNVTDMTAMFYSARKFNQNISSWNVNNVTIMYHMFAGAFDFNQDISAWDVSHVTSMQTMFIGASDFNQDLSAWDISLVTNMTDMFTSATLSVTNYDNTLIGWNTLDAGETQIPTNITFSGGNSKYCAGEAARTTLISTYGWTITDSGINCAEVSPKIVLQGAALNPNTGEEMLMRDDLRVAGLLPTTSPYTDAVVANATVFNTGGALGVGPIADDIVDWVFVELRDASNSTDVLASQSALLQRDGNVVAIDGVSNLVFDLGADNYFVAIKHRNHLGIMTADSVLLDALAPVLDFTDANNPITNGTNAQTTYGMPNGVVAMWAGDANNNSQVRYLGPSNDTNSIKTAVINHSGNTSGSNFYPYTEYDNADLNLNGQVRYLGPGNDTNILKSIILAHPDNTSSSNFYPFSQQF